MKHKRLDRMRRTKSICTRRSKIAKQNGMLVGQAHRFHKWNLTHQCRMCRGGRKTGKQEKIYTRKNKRLTRSEG